MPRWKKEWHRAVLCFVCIFQFGRKLSRNRIGRYFFYEKSLLDAQIKTLRVGYIFGDPQSNHRRIGLEVYQTQPTFLLSADSVKN
jgi:hypothetical protein